ncbi:unnamed protein product [Acanthoscelides obtectus]|uniref:Uncharacterized protein n=1 Tax=Acanthoscelides obtectus TaxID=200917 RepID=A0A9P0LR02_ACAOB|nr:unnamed protein product [Acanthoscelides obtectus]CAK1663569.1 Murinoglobulin-1 [Acanthoscelides obtectus]
MCNIFSLLLIFLSVHQAFASDNITENIVKKSGGFLLSVPKVLVSGKNETVCLSLHEARLPAKAIIDLKWREKHLPTLRNLEAEHTCFDMIVPNLPIKEPQFVSIKVQVQLNGSIQSAHNLDPIVVYPHKLVKTFIHTDRGLYKPGDKVRFRLLILDENLLPDNSKVPVIKIKNPLDVTVAAWENITPENGLLSLEYTMVQESLTGKWKIEALDTTKTFEVLKYTLPRYKIDLVYPKLIYYKADKLKISVCSRYAHGRYVKGLSLIKITDSYGNMPPVHRLQELENGCTDFIIPSQELALENVKDKFPMYDPKVYLQMAATVTEKGTNRIDITTGRILVYLKPYLMKFSATPMFQPGLPYKGRLKLFNVNVDLKHEVVEICYNLAIKKSWNYLNNEQCSNFSVSEESTVDFTILPLRHNVIHINLNARSLNHTEVGDSALVVRLHSLSNSYIYLHQDTAEKAENECRSPEHYKVFFTTDEMEENENVTFYFMVKTSSHIYKLRKLQHVVKKRTTRSVNGLKNIIGQKHKFVKSVANIDSFHLKFRLDKRILTKYQLLVYYVANNGEVIAVSKTNEVKPCLMEVNAKWSQKQVIPGATTTLNIKTGADSLCSLSAVDKSVKFLPNNYNRFDVSTLLKAFALEEREAPQSSRKSCIPPMRKNHKSKVASMTYHNDESVVTNDTSWELRRRKRHIYPFSEDYDAYDIFSKFGTVTISNLKIVTKPCYNGPLIKDHNQVQFMTEQYDDQNEEQAVSIRSDFPETWLWELIPVSDHVQLRRHLPHSITNWMTNVVCVSGEEGVGISPEIEISSFQSFFVEVLSPYSVKRDEAVYLYIHVSNYLNHRFPIRVILRLSNGLKMINPNEKLSKSFCLKENDTITHLVQVKATSLETAEVTVLSEVDTQYPLACGPETIISKRDIVMKKILVESEGYPTRLVKSALLCTHDSGSNNISWFISTPKEVVPGTAKATVIVNGDLFGQTIEHLEELLDVPTGCGEQIVASMAPNLYVLRYLNSTNTLKPSIKQRIIRNLKIGYQRILNYVHKDGSFSAFGYHDPTGSMFLTSFVVRTLQDAKQYIYVDQRLIDKAIAWIYDHQLENGCFSTMLHVFQDMGGTSKENSTATLTAYVILSLLEANIDVPKQVQTNIKYCIRSQHNPDKYYLAIICYALFKLNWNTEANRFLKRLIAVSEQQENLLWWTNKDNSTATDIEITSYVLLSLLHESSTENLAYAQSVVRWLTAKFGPKGGFKSTQDTVVALDALSRFAKIVKSRSLHINVHVEAGRHKQNFTLQSNDPLKSKAISVHDESTDVNIAVRGEGCVLAQVYAMTSNLEF